MQSCMDVRTGSAILVFIDRSLLKAVIQVTWRGLRSIFY